MRFRLVCLSVPALLLFGLALPGDSMAQRIRTNPDHRPQVPSKYLEGKVVALTLEQVIEMAFTNNLDITVSRYSAQMAANSVIEEEGTFDPILGANTFNQDQARPSANILETGTTVGAIESTTGQYQVGAEQQLPYGARWSVDTTATRSETSRIDRGLNPTYFANLNLSYDQPLLRNMGRDSAQYLLRVARNSRHISDEAFRNQVMLVTEQTVKAYWDLVFTLEDLAVRERSMELAKDLLRQNRIMVEVGTLAPIEITVAEAEVASRKEAILVSEKALMDAQDYLLNVVNMPSTSPAWDASLYPLDLPPFEQVDVDVDAALALALENRPEIAQKKLEMSNSRLGMDFYRNQQRPQLDLQLKVVFEGLAGDEVLPADQPQMAAPQTTGYGGYTTDMVIDQFVDGVLAQHAPLGTGSVWDAYDQVFGGDFDTWSIGLVFSYPIGNKAAKARMANARLDYEQTLVESEQLLNDIRVEVRMGVRALKTNLARVAAAGETRRLREEQLRAERKKFVEGLSTNYQVLQFQRDLEESQLTETQAVVDYAKSIVELKRITGELLQDLGVQLILPQPTVLR